jgi:tRNA C32,U32 (ribose-2'-O)-methylase TrmJ
MNYFEDHGLPLVQLREQRRELVVALIGRKDPISNVQIAEIASLQQAIAAMEAVVGDLDSQIEFSPARRQSASAFSIARRPMVGNVALVFGRRGVAAPVPLRLAR